MVSQVDVSGPAGRRTTSLHEQMDQSCLQKGLKVSRKLIMINYCAVERM